MCSSLRLLQLEFYNMLKLSVSHHAPVRRECMGRIQQQEEEMSGRGEAEGTAFSFLAPLKALPRPKNWAWQCGWRQNRGGESEKFKEVWVIGKVPVL